MFPIQSRVVVIDCIEEQLINKRGTVVGVQLQHYLNQHIYSVKLDDGYTLKFSEHELDYEE